MSPKPEPSTSLEEMQRTRAWKVFWAITAYPKTIVLLSIVLIAGAAYFVPQTTRDTRGEAFLGFDHPALVYRDKVEEIFGLRDPVVVAVVNDGEHGVFNPKTLELVSWLTDEIMDIEGVDPDRITSLATENDIYGTEDGMIVEPFFEYPPEDQAEAEAVREKVMDFPLYLGSLVAEDGSATLIVAELLDAETGAKNYQNFLALIDRAPIENGEVLHIAGEGAVAEFLGAYIDRDAQRLNPISAIVITLVILIAFRTLRGIFIPNLVVLGAIAYTLGIMAAAGVPFYVITNSLPVIVIAISVADAIHILNTYYEELAFHPDESQRNLVVRSMVHMWRPVTFTSFTDVAGFMGLSLASFMPPMRFFGYFASIGVLAALFFSLTMVPAILVLLKPKQSAPFKRLSPATGHSEGDAFSRAMGRIGRGIIAYPRTVLAVSLVITIAGVAGAFQLEVNEERITVFKETEPIFQANAAINDRLDGTNFMDIVVETPEVEGLFNVDYLRRIEALQAYVETLPDVEGTTSIVDYMKQMNRATNEDRLDAYVLPEQDNLIAQYFLLYSASGDPTDFEEEIDYDYRMANIRATMNNSRFQAIRPVVLATEQYLEETFETEGLEANLAGTVYMDYHWIKELAPSHFKGVILAFIGVWAMASLSFRSSVAGLIATTPVALALLAIYAVMGMANIWLGIGTTMFAAISIGLSVDFSIHTVDRLIALVRDQKRGLDEAFDLLYPSTGRALLFSFAALGLGFSVLITSEVPPLNRFGALVALAVTVSFISSLTVVPALVKVFRPAFLQLDQAAGAVVVEKEKEIEAVTK